MNAQEKEEGKEEPATTSTVLTIRQARTEDLPALTRLLSEAMVEMVIYPGQPELGLILLLISAAVNNGEAVFVATTNGELVGYCAWLGSCGVDAQALGTYVARRYRRLGISLMLREATAEHCRALGFEGVVGMVHFGNEAGDASARKAGFEPIGQIVRKKL